MRSVGLGFCTVLLFIGGCTTSDLDDLKSGSTGGAGSNDSSTDQTSGKCQEGVDCSGCVGCAVFCGCAAPKAFNSCMESCDAGAGSGGAFSGGGTSSGGGAFGGGGSPGDGGGAAGAATCKTTIQGKKCTDIIVTTSACGQCTASKCCAEFDLCLADQNCSGLLECLVNKCATSPDPNACVQQQCPACVPDQATLELYNKIGSCINSSCTGECGQP